MGQICWMLVITAWLSQPGPSSGEKQTCFYNQASASMDCRDVNIPRIRPGGYPLNVTTTRHLILTSTGLTTIEQDALYSLSLYSLRMDNNHLSHLDRDLFMGSSRIEFLSMENNEIEELDTGIFLPLYNLVVLLLNNNRLAALPGNLFGSQGKLLILEMRSNRIATLGKGVLLPLWSLERLELQYNPLVCNSDLRTVVLISSTRCIRSSGNCSQSGESWESLLPRQQQQSQQSRCTKSCVYVRPYDQMDCSNLGLRFVSGLEYALDDTRFTSISINRNGFEYLEPDTFQKHPQLIFVDLSWNALVSLPPRVFSPLHNLTALDLSNNKIQYLDDNLFVSQTELTDINLEENSITKLSSQMFEPLISLQTLLMDGNPVNCSCEVKPTYVLTSARGVHAQLTCNSPAKYKGKQWAVLQEDDCNASPLDWDTSIFLYLLLLCFVVVYGCAVCCSCLRKRLQPAQQEQYDDVNLDPPASSFLENDYEEMTTYQGNSVDETRTLEYDDVCNLEESSRNGPEATDLGYEYVEEHHLVEQDTSYVYVVPDLPPRPRK